MEYRRLGNSDLRVSAVGLGCTSFGDQVWEEGVLDEAASVAVVHEALDQGITLFDTAESYGKGLSEEYLGRALGARRPDVIIATKFGHWRGVPDSRIGGSRDYILQAVEGSLRRLGTDYIDLYQMHLPDVDTPIEETLEALDRLVQRGVVRWIGSSNFSGEQIAAAARVSSERDLQPFVSAQNEWSLLRRDVEADVVPSAVQNGVGVIPYFPLAAGFLTGKYQRAAPLPANARLTHFEEHQATAALSDARFDALEALTNFAEAHGHTILELALAWLASQPAVASVIAGATTPAQVRSNAVATLAWQLDEVAMAEVDRILASTS
jgi:aryl-alcohol dehydrogenase-like predicted oxidoreductase